MLIEAAARASRAAVLDLGSNSVKMVCYKLDHAGVYRPYRRDSVGVRMDEYGRRMINMKTIDDLMPILMMYRNITQHDKIDKVYTVATSAIREAENREFVIETIRRRVGFDAVVLSGDEEALCAYAGAASHLNIPSCILFDLGGGSLEIVSVRNHTILQKVSLPLGGLVLTRKFAGTADLDAQSARLLRIHVREVLSDLQHMEPLGNNALLVGVGGALRSVARCIQDNTGYPLRKLHNYAIEPVSIHHIAQMILSMDTKTLAHTYEIGRGRADIIKAGAIIISEVVRKFGLQRLIVSSVGLREGVLGLATRYAKFNHNCISEYHVRELVRPPRSKKRMPQGAASIIRFVESTGCLANEEFRVLWAAAVNIEEMQTFRDADDFAYRMLDKPSTIPHRIQLLSAICLVRSRKPKRSKLLVEKYSKVLQPGDEQTIIKLAPILYLCDIVITAEATISMSMQTGAIQVRVHFPVRVIPKVILERACYRIGRVLGLRVTIV